jgi:hypothetical protein
MNKNELNDFMTFTKEGEKKYPLAVFEVNGSFIIAVFQGGLSEFDILIKYRQKQGNTWSRIRTPKHIHWAVDILIKMHKGQRKTKEFLGFLIGVWDNTHPVKSKQEQKERLTIDSLLEDCNGKINEFNSLSNKGEYSIKFLILLAKLLMIQEKSNREDAYMFKDCLKALKSGKDIFSVVSIASHVGR